MNLDSTYLAPNYIVQKIAPLDLDANTVNTLLETIAKQEFPNDRHYMAKAFQTPWGEALLSKSVRSHRVQMQTMNASGNGATVAEILKAVRAVDVDRSVADGSGGQERHDNTLDSRVQPSAHQNPPSSTPPNGSFEDSYDAQKLSLAMKEDLLRHMKENPHVSYDKAVATMGAKWAAIENEIKQAGASRRFANMRP